MSLPDTVYEHTPTAEEVHHGQQLAHLQSIDETLQGILQRLDAITMASQSGAQVLMHVFKQLEPLLAGLATNPMLQRLISKQT